jgi:hypothetical protein
MMYINCIGCFGYPNHPTKFCSTTQSVFAKQKTQKHLCLTPNTHARSLNTHVRSKEGSVHIELGSVRNEWLSVRTKWGSEIAGVICIGLISGLWVLRLCALGMALLAQSPARGVKK